MKAILAGTGWRAGFYHRIAEKIPELLTITGVYSHREGYIQNLEEALRAEHDCVIVSTSKEQFFPLMKELKERGERVFSETTFLNLTDDEQDVLMGMDGYAAEQYPYTPLYGSIISSLHWIGPVSQIRLSGLHNHHAAAIARKVLFLGVAMPDEISSADFPYRILKTASRDGLCNGTEMEECTRKLRILRFGGKLFINDFSSNQYHSVFYGKEIEIRGERGVITEKGIITVNDDGKHIELPFVFHRDDYHDFRGIDYVTAGEHMVWKNRFPGRGLTDDEVGIAELLYLFSEHSEGYPIREGILDARLGKML